MKYIKSILALSLTALLSTSAWAEDGTLNLCVGDVVNIYESHGSSYTPSLAGNTDSTVASGTPSSAKKAGLFYTVTALKVGQTKITFENKKTGTTLTLALTVNVSAARTIAPNGTATVTGWDSGSEGSGANWSAGTISPSGFVTVDVGSSLTATLTGKTVNSGTVKLSNVSDNKGSEFIFAVTVEAEKEYTFGTHTVKARGAEKVTVSGSSSDLVLKFAESGTLTLPEDVMTTARLLVVGGGASGAASNGSSAKYGYSGNGGAGSDKSYTMPSGTYTVSVGAGGAANNQKGSDSSISLTSGIGFATVTGTGGAAISGTTAGGTATAGSSGFSKTSDIMGSSSITYGKPGVKASSTSYGTAGGANTGGGGVGGYYTNSSNHDGGAGGSGIVVVRISAMKVTETKASATSITDNGGAQQITLDDAFSTAVAWNSSVSSGDSGIATATMVNGATATKTPTMSITSVGIGTTKLTVKNSGSTDSCDYTWTVTVTVTEAPRETEFNGGTVTTVGAVVAEQTDGDLLLTFTRDGSLQMSKSEDARILVVGGGGSGAAGKDGNSERRGSGGGGGKGSEGWYSMPVGTYAVDVGAGGPSVTSPSSKGATDGKSGEESSIGGVPGFETITGDAGSGGIGSGSDGSGGCEIESSISGTLVTYGTNGVMAASSVYTDGGSGVSPGSGGHGAHVSSSATTTVNSGKGVDGIVIVRLILPVAPAPCGAVTGAAITYGDTLGTSVIANEGDNMMTNAAGEKVEGVYTWKNTSLKPSVADSETTEYEVVFTPDAEKYGPKYLETTVKAKLTVNRKSVAVPTATSGLTYNGSELTGVVATQGCTVTGGSATTAGDHSATAVLDDKANTCWADTNDTADKTINWSIARQTVTVPTATSGLTYNGSEQTGVAATTGCTVSGGTATAAGTHTATATLNDTANTCWAGSTSDVEAKQIPWSIGRKAVAVPQAKTGLVYDKKEQTGVEATDGCTVGGQVKGTDAQNYTATAVLADKANTCWAGTTDDSADRSVPWSIARKSVTVTADNKSKTYGEEDPQLTATVAGTIDSDTVVYNQPTRAEGEGVSTYKIAVTGDAVQGNYAVTFVDGVFTINKATPEPDGALTLTLTYGDTLGGKASEVVGTMKFKTTVVEGTYVFAESTKMPKVAETGTGFAATFKPTYTSTYGDAAVTVVVTVNRKAVTVTADNKTVDEGDEPPTYTSTYDGLVAGESESVFTKKPTYACDYTGGEAGTYTITPSGAEADNYTFTTYTPGTLTVNAKTVKQRITVSNYVTVSGTDDQPIYTCTDTLTSRSKTIKIPDGYVATAEILVVGGGGGGGGGYYNKSGTTTTKYYANGGNGGEVIIRSGVEITSQTLTIVVGGSGTAGSNSGSNGGNGSDSSISALSLTAKGGAGGNGGSTTKKTSADSTSAGTSNPTSSADRTTSISGGSSPVTYGTGGAKAGTSGTASAGGNNTGDGGQGGRAGSSSGYAGGAGGSGIVIVKITALKKVVTKSSEITLLTTDAATDLSAPSAFAAACTWAATSDKTSVATVTVNDSTTSTKTPSIKITPVASGTATITVTNTAITASYGFTWKVTVTVAEPTEVLLDETATVATGVALGGRYYYKMVSEDTTSVTVDPSTATLPSSGVSTTGDLKVTGVKETTSPVLVRLQTNGSTYSTGGTYSDVKVYSVTVVGPTEGRDVFDLMQYHTTNVATTATLTHADVSGSTASMESVTVDGNTATVVAGSANGVATVKLYNGETLVKVLKVTVVDQQPEEGSATLTVGQGRPTTYTTISDITRAEVTEGGDYLETPTVSGKTVSIKAKSTYDVSSTVQLYNGNILIKTLTVSIIEAPDQIVFKGRMIEYKNATTNTTSALGELILTFTDTAKAGFLSIPENATARVLLVGGGAGGVIPKTSSQGYYLNGSGGHAGEVIERKLQDAFTLGKGDYTIQVGAGGAGLSAIPSSLSSDDPNMVCGGVGSSSSLVGGGIELVARGGGPRNGNVTGDYVWYRLADLRQTEDIGTRVGDNSGSSTGWGDPIKAYDGTGAAHFGAETTDEGRSDQTGIQSDISGTAKWYGVGGIGPCSNVSVDGADADANTGNGGNGGATGNGGTTSKGADAKSGAGGSGIVIVRITYPDTPIVDTLEATSIIQGETLADSIVTLTMTNAAGESVAGTFAWDDATTVPAASDYFLGTFTPNDTASYAIVPVSVPVVVKAPIEATELISVSTLSTKSVYTTTEATLWSFEIVSGSENIRTPQVVTRTDNTAEIKIYGVSGKVGSAIVDIYGDVGGNGSTFVKRIKVAVLPVPPEGEIEVSVNEDESITVATSGTSTQWNFEVLYGGELVTANVDPASSGSAQATTLTVNGLSAGTAIININKGSTMAGEGTLVKRAIVTVVAPSEGRESRAVGQGKNIKVTTEASIDSYKTVPADATSTLAVALNGKTTTITGVAKNTDSVQVRLYSGSTLVKVVTVLVTDPPSIYTWQKWNKTISYLGTGSAPTEAGDDLLFTFTSTDGLLELPADAIADVLVVGGGASGVSTKSSEDYRGDGGGGGKAVYEENYSLAGGVYMISVGDGGVAQAIPTSSRLAAGVAGNPSSLSNGGSVDLTALGGTSGSGGGAGAGRTAGGKGGAELTGCMITGFSKDYGMNGVAGDNGGTSGTTGVSGGANTGNGGMGGWQSKAGNGGSGVVIVCLKGFIETPVVNTDITGTVTYGETYEATKWTGSMKNSNGDEVLGSFAWQDPTALSITVADSKKPYSVVFTPNDTTFYTTVTVEGQLIVNAKPVTVTARSYEKVVGNPDPTLEYDVTSGELVGSEKLVGSLTWNKTNPEVASTNDIVQANDWVNPNYEVVYVKGTMTVKTAVASYSGVNYDSVSNAVTAATETTGGSGAVTVLVDTDEKIVIPENSSVTIDPNGKETGGVVNNGEMDVKIPDQLVEVGSTQVVFTVEGSGKINAITTTDASKEVVFKEKEISGGKKEVTATVRTSADVLGQTKPDGEQSLTNKIDKLREFLLENKIEAYTKAHTTAGEISAALNGTGANTLELWKDYALGITPETPVAPVAKPDGDTDDKKITLALPDVAAAADKQSGDYTITYEVTGGDEKIVSDTADAIKVPLATGTYTIKAVFTPKVQTPAQ